MDEDTAQGAQGGAGGQDTGQGAAAGTGGATVEQQHEERQHAARGLERHFDSAFSDAVDEWLDEHGDKANWKDELNGLGQKVKQFLSDLIHGRRAEP